MVSIFVASKRLVNSALNLIGLELRRVPPAATKGPRRDSMRGALENMRTNGLAPKTVIDVGVAIGTADLYETFPDSHHILIEPLTEYETALKMIKRNYANLDYILAAAGPSLGKVKINVHPDLVGSSLFLEHEDTDVNGVPREVPCTTVDHVVEHFRAIGPYLIKIDVQGAELEVLLGGKKTLINSDCVILEVVLFDFFQERTGLFFKTLDFMKSHGFVVHDVFGLLYRPLDGALSQVDIVFVKETSVLRKHHVYATTEQRSKGHLEKSLFPALIG